MNQEDDFNVDYYFTIIDKFYNVAVDFEMVGDKFFELQKMSCNITEEKIREVENHSAYKSCEKKLEVIAAILQKIK